MTENPVTIRAAEALPAAGAWDATPIEVSCAGFDKVGFYFTYTWGAAGGEITFQFQFSPYAVDQAGVEDWFCGSLYGPAIMDDCCDLHSEIQCEDIAYCAVDGTAQTFFYGPLNLSGVVERIRVPCRESGVTGTPGTAHAVAVFYN